MNDYPTLAAVLWVLAYLYLFWLAYIIVMGLYRAWLQGRLKGLALVLAVPVVLVAYVLDLVANWTIASLVFLEPPRRPFELVTDRLSGYIRTPYSGWRTRWAVQICEGLLDYFDPSGRHCV